MNSTDLLTMLPLTVVAVAVVVVMLAAALKVPHRVVVVITLAGLALALAALTQAVPLIPRTVTTLLVIDGYALFYLALILAAGIVVTLLAYGYLQPRPGNHAEFYLLLLLATLGAGVLVASSHFASFFFGIELMSVPFFALIAYRVDEARPLEGGIKYLILSGVSSAFLLFGMALLYADFGTLQFAQLGARLAATGAPGDPWLIAGVVLTLVGIGFKLGVVPFHMWAPDVYQAAPAPIGGFIATVSKGAALALLLRYFADSGVGTQGTLAWVLSVIAIASMLVGNLLALLQTNVKRLLAYSSIAHLGYLLVAFLAGGALAVESVAYYLVAYFITMLGAFGAITLLSVGAHGSDIEELDDYRGLFWRRPWLAGSFTAMLLSLAGIPLTVGFIAKFYVVLAGVDSALWTPVFVLVVGSAIGLFYYLRVILIMFQSSEQSAALPDAPYQSPASVHLTLVVLTVLLIWLGVDPAALVYLVQTLGATGMQ